MTVRFAYEYNNGRSTPAPLFKGTHPCRPLNVVVDAEIVDLTKDFDSPPETRALSHLLREHNIHALNISAEQPDESHQRTVPSAQVEYPPEADIIDNWITFFRNSDPDNWVRYRIFIGTGDGSVKQSATTDNLYELSVEQSNAYADLPKELAKQKQEKDLDLVSIVWTQRPDVYISRNPYILEMANRLEPLVHFRICSPSEAMSIILYYQRSWNNYYALHEGASTYICSENQLYEIALYDTIPELWSWAQIVFKSQVSSNGTNLMKARNNLLGIFVHSRRALIALDRLVALEVQPQTYRVSGEQVLFFDHILFSLSGMLDCLATEFNILTDKPYSSAQGKLSWAHSEFSESIRRRLRELNKKEGTFFMPLSDGIGFSYRDILSVLRNTVHEQPLQALYAPDTRRYKPLGSPNIRTRINLSAGLSDSKRSRLTEAVDSTDKLSHWRLWTNDHQDIVVEPLSFMRSLVVGVLSTVRAMAELIPNDYLEAQFHITFDGFPTDMNSLLFQAQRDFVRRQELIPPLISTKDLHQTPSDTSDASD